MMFDKNDEIVTIYVNYTKKAVKIGNSIIPLGDNINKDIPILNPYPKLNITDQDLILAKSMLMPKLDEIYPKINITVQDILLAKSKLVSKSSNIYPLAYIVTNEQPTIKNIVQVKNCGYEYYKKLISNDPYEIVNVPDNLITEELCLICVKQNGYLLKYLKMQSPAIVLQAIKQNGFALQFNQFSDSDEFIQAAIEQNPWTIKLVSDKMKYHQLAISKEPRILKLFMDHILDKKIYCNAVKENGYVIKYIPPKMQSVKLTGIALKQCKHYVQFIKNEDTLSIIDAMRNL
jgi:hypothetical protein